MLQFPDLLELALRDLVHHTYLDLGLRGSTLLVGEHERRIVE